MGLILSACINRFDVWCENRELRYHQQEQEKIDAMLERYFLKTNNEIDTETNYGNETTQIIKSNFNMR